MSEYQDQSGSPVETYQVGELLGREHGYRAEIPAGYSEVLSAGLSYLAQVKTERGVLQRFGLLDGKLALRCRSMNHAAAGHEFDELRPLSEFAKSSVARGNQVCKSCTQVAGRRWLRKRTPQPTLKPPREASSVYVVVPPGTQVVVCTAWDEVDEVLRGMKSPSGALVLEGRRVAVKRQVAFVKDD